MIHTQEKQQKQQTRLTASSPTITVIFPSHLQITWRKEETWSVC